LEFRRVLFRSAAQMGMGFILPFALVFVAIPLESFFHSSRTVLGLLGVGLLRALTWLLRLLGNLAWYLGSLLVHVYDLLIFAPLWLERLIKESRHKPEEITAAQTADH